MRHANNLPAVKLLRTIPTILRQVEGLDLRAEDKVVAKEILPQVQVEKWREV